MLLEAGLNLVVAPPAGAWIETTKETVDENGTRQSRPPRARGLKHKPWL
ncbi:hypothetical protein SPIROBIBN47_330026 [uncultured spirochete]|uniref:Uncharacterized protein n=1 Tax=uncultured spirochete TaxID=156406 RepID=A0A3P3XK65_9SPIR|nr:hypothetical protein SPIROBIBN47_330026 [uncultured spirochete]